METCYQGQSNHNDSDNVLSPVKPEEEHLVTRPLGMSWFLKVKDNGSYFEILDTKYFYKEKELTMT